MPKNIEVMNLSSNIIQEEQEFSAQSNSVQHSVKATYIIAYDIPQTMALVDKILFSILEMMKTPRNIK